MLKTLKALHNDERGDMAQIVLAVALIVIPLMLMLLAFGGKITEWFSNQAKNLDTKNNTVNDKNTFGQ